MSSIPQLLILLPLVYLAALLDAAVGPRLEVGDVAPDAFVLLAIVWLSARTTTHGYVAAGLIGLASDLCGPGRPGIGMACYLVAGYAMCHVLARLEHRHWLWRVGLLPLFGVALLTALAACRWLLGEASAPLFAVIRSASAAGLYTAALAAVAVIARGSGVFFADRAGTHNPSVWRRKGLPTPGS